MHHEGVWENRSTYTYYTELVLELAVLCVDFLHHVHMLLWANMFLSVASLILLMKLRFLYQVKGGWTSGVAEGAVGGCCLLGWGGVFVLFMYEVL